MRKHGRALIMTLAFGLALSCVDDVISSDGPSECIGGDLCVGSLVCVDGFCVPPGSESGEFSGDGDGDPGDGDGDGDPGDGDGSPTGDGDGDGECEPGTNGCPCVPNDLCDAGLLCVDNTCVPASCGNGVEEEGEECDDGNDDNTDTCLSTCVLASCGDGYVGPGEACDDPNMLDGDACTSMCTLASCGDGMTQAPEECDDGDVDNSDSCLSTCTNASCGDGFIHDGFEDCDDANPSNADDCLDSCIVASCGDGFVHQNVEDCDDDNMSNTDACVSGCVDASCGDGFVWADMEECDDANMVNTDTCVTGCISFSCGDGYVGPGEACDDGNNDNNDACTNSCALANCGDGVLGPGEMCDDANMVNTDGCLNTCVPASCGDGFVHQNVEACDDADADDTDNCLNSCALPSCGDGFVHQGVENCDDANVSDLDACLNSCELASCGDGFLHQGVENCDDANMNNGDACLNSCDAASCGDGYTLQGVEACDDANGNNNDACLDSCELANCGDGFLHQGVEQCDDGGNNNSDFSACTDSCESNVCGDSLIWVGVEQCDDGNRVPNDGCDACMGQLPVMFGRSTAHTCLLAYNTIRCWGAGSSGQLGTGANQTIGNQPGEMPPVDVDVGGTPIELHTGGAFNCALLDNGELHCWGQSDQGQLGLNSTSNRGDQPGEMPTPATNVGGQIAQVAVGHEHSCVLLVNSEVRCWGRGSFGELGYGNTNNIGDGPNEMPSAVVNDGTGNVVQIAAGAHHTCALTDTNKVRCWGYGAWGQLGYGNANNIGDGPGEMPPADVNLGAGTVIQIDLGNYASCALFDNNDVRCWGDGYQGFIGGGNTNDIGDGPGEMPPPNVNYGLGTPSELAGAGYFFQILFDDGNVRNWGDGDGLGYGNLNNIGDGPGEMPPANVAIGGNAIAISKGGFAYHSCVMLDDMTVRCWGINGSGQLGYGNTNAIGDAMGEMPPAPVPVF